MNPAQLSLPQKGPGGGPSTPGRQPSQEPQGGNNQGGGGGGGGGGGPSTNVDELNDAVGASGVDIAAEEERMRDGDKITPFNPGLDRSRKQTFLLPADIASIIRPIAQNYSLKAIEADAIPLIALACRQRLTSLLHASLAARNHRHSATHLRAPPLVSASRKRRRVGAPGSDDDSSDEEDELPEHLGGKPKEKPVPAWDQVVFDEQEKLLSVVERIERREENRLRKERGERDERERREAELAEQIRAQEAEAEGSGGAGGGGGTAGGGASTAAAASAVAGTSAAAQATTGTDGESTPKPKKKKATSKSAAAKAADIESRLANQTVSHALGGAKFAWLNTGAPASPAASSPLAGGPGKLPPPKFASASSLPKPSKLNPGAGADKAGAKGKGKGKGAAAVAAFPGAAAGSGLRGLDATPAEHEANRKREEEDEWAKGRNVVELGDLVWAMERERGMGTGRGSGRVAATKARGGVIGDKRLPF